MGNSLITQQIGNGVFFNTITDTRYKTNRISVNFITRLDSKTASQNAVVPLILEKCSADYPDFTQLKRKLDTLYGATVGAGVKKIGDCQVLTVAISSVDDRFALERENITQTLSDILAGLTLRPYLPDGNFSEKIFQTEKQNLLDLIESEINEKRGYAISRTEQIMGEGTPYGVNRFGTAKQAQELTREDVLAAYENLVKSAKIEIMFVGSGDSAPALKIFKSAFEKVSRDYSNAPETLIAKPGNSVNEVTDRFDVAQSKLVLGFKTGQEQKDIDALRVMTALYGQTPTSKLFVNVREKLSLCYYCAARYDRIKGVVMVDSGVENSNIEKAKLEILNQLEEIKKKNITEDELRFTKLSLQNSFKTMGDSASGLEAWYLGQRLLDKNASPEQEAKNIEGITAEDVARAAGLLKLDTVYLLTGKE